VTATPAQEVGLGDLQGLWRRVWLRAGGVEDATTTVLWRQGGEVHVDLRVPAEVMALAGCAALAELSEAELRSLAGCEGFAGTTEVRMSGCVWTRRINWRGPETGVDAGFLEQTEEGLLETGLRASYAELWSKVEGGPARTVALSGPEGALGFVVWSDRGFSLGRGAPRAMSGPPLEARIGAALAARDPAALASAFDMEFSSGAFVGAEARVEVSTDPSRVGARAFDRAALEGAGPVEIALTGFDGRVRAGLWTPRPV
jgi:hypothetical protein